MSFTITDMGFVMKEDDNDVENTEARQLITANLFFTDVNPLNTMR
jgi:hypothetical protein